MPISATFNTPQRIIDFAMADAGILQEGDVPSSSDYAKHMLRLNDLINLWQTQGLKLWVNALQNVTLATGVGTYALGPAGATIAVKPARVIEAYYYNATGESYPLIVMAWSDYNLLSNKAQRGAINSYFVNKQQDNIEVTFWLIPDTNAATGYVQLLLQKQITNMINLTEALSFPQEWFMGLRWGLADDICTGQPQAIMDRCAARAQAFREALENWDVEDAPTRFTPDPRGSWHRR